MPSIHQFMAGAAPGDAISNYAFEIQRLLKESGVTSRIYTPLQNTASEYRGREINMIEEYLPNASKDDIILYHYSISSKATEIYLKADCKRCICYHNITPGKYFINKSENQARILDSGREELKKLAGTCRVAISDSEFNSQELVEMGFDNTVVVPIKFPRDYLHTEPDINMINKYSDGKTNLLFVGRIVPNKRFEDLIKIFYFYNKTVNPGSRLLMVGTYTGGEKYYAYLKSLISELVLSETAIFTGHVKLCTLIACYRVANALVCASEHEGFCLPLLEAMQFNLPVFALKRAAVPETMGNAGVHFETMDHRTIAEVIGYVLSDPGLLNRVLKGQQKRLAEYNIISLKDRLFEIFNRYCGTNLK